MSGNRHRRPLLTWPATYTAGPATTSTNPQPTQGPVRATFVGGPRHNQTFELGPQPPELITVPSPEGTHAYERTSLQRRPIGSTELLGKATYKYIGVLNGSDTPDEVEMQLAQALAAVAEHVKAKTALSPGSIMLPDTVFPDATRVLGLDVVRGDRVALLLELM